MKKILLSAFGIFLGSSLIAQNIQETPFEPIENKIGNISETQLEVTPQRINSRSSNDAAAAGDVIWSEDFAGGFPADWTLSGANVAECAWKYSTQGSIGYFNGGNYPAAAPALNSTTAANGFLICDNDSANHTLYGQPAGSTYQELETYFTTSVIDLTGHSLVRLEFEHYFRFYGNDIDLLVSVSTDGSNWTDFTAQEDFTSNDASDDPMRFSMDVSSIIGGSATAYVKIGWSSLAYFWMIDDIKIVSVPNNDLAIGDSYFRTAVDTGAMHYYTAIPESQIENEVLQFSAKVANVGAVTQPNTILTNNITTPTGTVTTNSAVADVAAGTVDSLMIADEFTFDDGVGTYSFALSTSSDSVDSYIGDNAADTIRINVTDSTYARDRDAVGNYSYGPGSTFEMGPLFDIYDTVKATSVSIALGDNSAVGDAISIYIYDDTFTPISAREFITLTADDISGLATFAIPEVLLTPGQYVVTYKTYTDAVYFRRSPFDADAMTVFVDVSSGGTWYYTSAVPVIRLNVSTDLWVCDLAANAVQTGDNMALATAINGTAPYSYLWSNGDVTESVSGLTSGQVPGYEHTVTITDDSSCVAKATVSIVTGIIEAGIEGDISLYPNPNNGEFQLNLDNVDAGIYNVSVKNIVGQNVYQNVINVTGSYNANVKLANMQNGIYFMEILNNNGDTSVIRFVVK